MQQSQVEVSVEAVRLWNAEKVRLNEELYRKDGFIKAVYICGNREVKSYIVRGRQNKTNNKTHIASLLWLDQVKLTQFGDTEEKQDRMGSI